MKKFYLAWALVCLLNGAARVNASILYPENDGFEAPDQGASYTYDTAGGNWTFVGDSGETANGTAWYMSGATNGNHDATISSYGQGAFVQLDGHFFQSISGFVAGTATISFSIENRSGYGLNPVDVKLDAHDFGTFLSNSAGSFNQVTTTSVAVTPGSHTLEFFGTNAIGDTGIFVDNVFITNNPTSRGAVVPEPGSLLVLGLGLAAVFGLSGMKWRKTNVAAV